MGVLGGRIEGWGLFLAVGLVIDPVRGVPKRRDVRGPSVTDGTAEIYVASSDTCTCARVSSNAWGGWVELFVFSKAGCLRRNTKKDCSCSSALK